MNHPKENLNDLNNKIKQAVILAQPNALQLLFKKDPQSCFMALFGPNSSQTNYWISGLTRFQRTLFWKAVLKAPKNPQHKILSSFLNENPRLYEDVITNHPQGLMKLFSMDANKQSRQEDANCINAILRMFSHSGDTKLLSVAFNNIPSHHDPCVFSFLIDHVIHPTSTGSTQTYNVELADFLIQQLQKLTTGTPAQQSWALKQIKNCLLAGVASGKIDFVQKITHVFKSQISFCCFASKEDISFISNIYRNISATHLYQGQPPTLLKILKAFLLIPVSSTTLSNLLNDKNFCSDLMSVAPKEYLKELLPQISSLPPSKRKLIPQELSALRLEDILNKRLRKSITKKEPPTTKKM